jgi:hypothetical protein
LTVAYTEEAIADIVEAIAYLTNAIRQQPRSSTQRLLAVLNG